MMTGVEWGRKIVGGALLLCGWVVALGVIGGLLWEGLGLLGQYFLVPCWLLTVPLSLLHALLALPGGATWEERLRRSMVMKLLLIPFFVANFILGIIGVAIFFIGGLLLTLGTVFVAFFVLLATSVDVIRALILMRLDGRITTWRMIWHGILQLICCVDVIDACVLWLGR